MGLSFFSGTNLKPKPKKSLGWTIYLRRHLPQLFFVDLSSSPCYARSMKIARRSRRSMLDQLETLKHSVGMFVESRGKNRGHFPKMPPTLQNDFVRLDSFLRVVKSKYESFLYETEGLDLPESAKEIKVKYQDALSKSGD